MTLTRLRASHSGTLSRGAGEGSAMPSGRLGVFAGQLRREVRVVARRLLVGLFVALEARLARPGPLQIVIDAEGQAAEALSFELDLVTVHKRVEAAMVGAGGDDVAGQQRVDR